MPETKVPITPVHTSKTRFWLAAALSWILICLTLLAYCFALPTDGWLAVEPDGFDSHGFIFRQNVMGLPSNLQPGDWVTEIQGVPIVNGLYIAPEGLENNWRTGGSVEYTVLREGQTITLQVPQGRWTVEKVIGATVFGSPAMTFTWFGLIVFLFVSWYAFWRRPGLPSAVSLCFWQRFCAPYT